MIATRLLMAARGAGGFTVLGTPVALTASAHGGWTQKPKARALWHASHSYLGFVATSGNIEVVVVPDSTGVGGTPIVLHSALQVDTHAAPALIVRSSDNKLVVLYCQHNGTIMYQRISVNSLDSDPTISGGFAAEATAFTGSDLTYPMVFERTAESGSPLYCWFRETVTLTHRNSTDGGVTWTSAQPVYADGSNHTYWDISLAPDGMRFDFVVTDTSAVGNQLGSLRHMYADATAYHQSDGTVIDETADPLPFAPSSLTLVYDEATDGPAWSHDLYNVSGPVFIAGIAASFSLPGGGTDTEYRVWRWTGSAWASSTVLASGGAGQFDPLYGALDAVDVTVAYVTRKTGSTFDLWRYRSSDGLVTWDTGILIATGGIYPVSIQGHPAPGLAVLWLDPDTGYVDATNYTLRVMGLVA